MNYCNYEEYVRRAYLTAVRHGFHDEELPLCHFLMLVITEVCEMVEADSMGRRANVDKFKDAVSQEEWNLLFEENIKDTVEDEMADVCIRLFDLAGLMEFVPDGIDSKYLPDDYFERFRSRPFTLCAYELCGLLARCKEDKYEVRVIIELALGLVTCWAKAEGIDLEWHINQKMMYNEQCRERLHGKKY